MLTLFPNHRKAVASQRLGCSTCRGGFTVTELVVAASLLVVVMSLVVSLTVRGGRIQQDARHYRLAMDELSNHLDRLTSLAAEDLPTAIENLSPSPELSETLPNPVISVDRIEDNDGSRLVLEMTWDRLGKNKPVALVAWLDPLPPGTDRAAKDDDSAEEQP